MKRRAFLRRAAMFAASSPLVWAGAGSYGLTACGAKQVSSPVQGGFVGPNHALGHRLRNRDFPAYSETRAVDIGIAGAGVSGLSAGWQLKRRGFDQFAIFELEASLGGNARSGQNATGAFPWGAHYLPIPNAESHLLKAFLAECGVIVGQANTERPEYHPHYLCFAPEERLFMHGAWQEGLVPMSGLSKDAQQELKRFHSQMQGYKQAYGNDGKKAFTIPHHLSSNDPAFRLLDAMSMHDFLQQQHYRSEALYWYVNYGARDDYGVDCRRISAWAGIHYFASRTGQAMNAEDDQVLTWPEGNGWLVRQLAQGQNQHIHTQAVIVNIEQTPDNVLVDSYSPNTNKTTRWTMRALIYAMPVHTLPYTFPSAEPRLLEAARRIPHAPWLVANLSVEGWPNDEAMAWDNVLYKSQGLGYVNAQHQLLRQHAAAQRVLTYYRPFAEYQEHEARQRLFTAAWQDWSDAILLDLAQAHPQIAQRVTRIDIMRWAHAMTYPYVGFLSDSHRTVLQQAHGRLFLAHTDVAGISIFEEAFDQGTRAADRALQRISL